MPRPRRRQLLLVGMTALTACAAPLTRGVPDRAAPTPSRAPAPTPETRPRAADARARADRRISDADLDALAARRLMVPVDGIPTSKVADTFEARRVDGTGAPRAHLALDIMAPRGTAVVAADDGVIGRLSSNALGGITIYVRDLADRFVHYYAHLDRYRDGLAVGDTVYQGTTLGYVGTTGNAPRDLPHLHWQVMLRGADRRWWDGIPLNPWHFLVLDGRARDASSIAGPSRR